MKLGCSLGTYTFQDYKVERPAYSLHHCAVLKNTYFRHWFHGFSKYIQHKTNNDNWNLY